MWKEKVDASADEENRSQLERKAIIEQYNCAIHALREYKSHALTESPLLNAVVKLEDDANCLGTNSGIYSRIVVNAGNLSLPVFKINAVDILGDLPNQFECTEEECRNKTVAIYPGLYLDEIHQMMKVLYPECNVHLDDVALMLGRDA